MWIHNEEFLLFVKEEIGYEKYDLVEGLVENYIEKTKQRLAQKYSKK